MLLLVAEDAALVALLVSSIWTLSRIVFKSEDVLFMGENGNLSEVLPLIGVVAPTR